MVNSQMSLLNIILTVIMAMVSGHHTASIPSAGMAPTLMPGDRVLYKQYSRLQKPQRGDLVVFVQDEGRSLKYLKRLIGLPGETVSISSDRIEIDGQELSEPYLFDVPDYEMSAIKLGQDHYFVLGDSRNNSYDSHIYGAIRGRQILGRVDYLYWPLDRAGSLSKNGYE